MQRKALIPMNLSIRENQARSSSSTPHECHLKRYKMWARTFSLFIECEKNLESRICDFAQDFYEYFSALDCKLCVCFRFVIDFCLRGNVSLPAHRPQAYWLASHIKPVNLSELPTRLDVSHKLFDSVGFWGTGTKSVILLTEEQSDDGRYSRA